MRVPARLPDFRSGRRSVRARRRPDAERFQSASTRIRRGPGVPQPAMDRYGRFLVVWSGQGQGDLDGIFAQRYRSSGVPAGASSGSTIPLHIPSTSRSRVWMAGRVRVRLDQRGGRRLLQHDPGPPFLGLRRAPGHRVPGQHVHDGRPVRSFPGHGTGCSFGSRGWTTRLLLHYNIRARRFTAAATLGAATSWSTPATVLSRSAGPARRRRRVRGRVGRLDRRYLLQRPGQTVPCGGGLL